jgi:hypothetical protein
LGAVFEPGCHISKGKAALVEYENIAAIKASLFKLDPYHLLYGTSACDDLWMWTEEVREKRLKILNRSIYQDRLGTNTRKR